MIDTVAIVTAFVLLGRLGSPTAPAAADWKVAEALCCCKTHTGGQCCTEAATCGGKPLGCFCASPSVPAPKKRIKSTPPKKPVGKLTENPISAARPLTLPCNFKPDVAVQVAHLLPAEVDP